MAFSHVSGQGAEADLAAGTVILTLPNAPAVGNLVLVGIGWYDGTNTSSVPTVQDGNGNTYTVVPAHAETFSTVAGSAYLAYWVATGTPHKTITVSFPINAAVAAEAFIDEFSAGGAGTISLSSGSDTAGTGTAGTSINTPTVPVGAAGTLVYFVTASGSQVTGYGGAFTAGGGAPTLPTAMGMGVCYALSQSSNTTNDMTQAVNSEEHWDSVGAAFIISAGGGGTPARIIITPT
jgi:hypothetical protein